IEHDVDAAGVLILVQNFVERAAAIERAEDSALDIRTVRMSEDGDEQTVGIARIDGDHRNLLTVAKSEMRPCFSSVGRLVDAIAGREIGTLQSFAAPDIDDVRIGR